MLTTTTERNEYMSKYHLTSETIHEYVLCPVFQRVFKPKFELNHKLSQKFSLI